MKCGAHSLEDHVCDGYPRPIYQRMMRTPCLNPAIRVKYLAGSQRYGFEKAKTYHTCAQFTPTDPNHPWNFEKYACNNCQIDHSVEVPCKIALDFEALTYDKWKSQNCYRLQVLPLCTSLRQCRHAQMFNGLQPQE